MVYQHNLGTNTYTSDIFYPADVTLHCCVNCLFCSYIFILVHQNLHPYWPAKEEKLVAENYTVTLVDKDVLGVSLQSYSLKWEVTFATHKVCISSPENVWNIFCYVSSQMWRTLLEQTRKGHLKIF